MISEPVTAAPQPAPPASSAAALLPPPVSVSALPPRRERALPRVRRALSTAWGYFPLTPVGLAVVSVALTAGWFEGVAHLDMVVLMVSFSVLVALALMALLVAVAFGLTRSAFRQNRSRTCSRLEADTPNPTGWSIRLPFWLPCVDISWSWEKGEQACEAPLVLHLEGDQTLEVAIPKRRGAFTRVIRRIQVRDILGLSCISWRLEEAVDLTVLPNRGQVEQMVPLVGFISGDDISDPYGDPWGDRVDMRQYAPGDSPRMIMWKVFARSRKLMVRIPERAVTARPRGCGYFVADGQPRPLDEPSAGVARVMIERRLLGEGWSFAADQGGAPATTVDDALEALAASGSRLAGLGGDGQTGGFGDFLQRSEREGYGYCALFVPPRPGPWLDPLVHAIRRSSLRVHVLVGMDGIDDVRTAARGPAALLRRVILRADDLQAPTLTQLTEVITKLSACTASVSLVDRRTGQLIPHPHATVRRATEWTA